MSYNYFSLNNLQKLLSNLKVIFDTKQDKLIEGANITIDPVTNVISSTGGGGSSVNVVNNLTSESTTSALSANQGRVLNEALETKLNNEEVSKKIQNEAKDGYFLYRYEWQWGDNELVYITEDIYQKVALGNSVAVGSPVYVTWGGITYQGNITKCTSGLFEYEWFLEDEDNTRKTGYFFDPATNFNLKKVTIEDKLKEVDIKQWEPGMSVKPGEFYRYKDKIYKATIATTAEPVNGNNGWSIFTQNVLNDIAQKVDITGAMSSTNPTGTGKFSMNQTTNYNTLGAEAVSFGENNAGGDHAFAEGYHNNASGAKSFAANQGTVASGGNSAAFGYACQATQNESFARGNQAQAKALGSFSSGYGTQAVGDYQHAIGKYNETSWKENYAFLVGNGASATARSNALELDWNGNLMIAGVLSGGVSSIASAYDATKSYIIGDYCYKGGKLYRCILNNNDGTATPPNTTYWVEVSLESELKTLKSDAIYVSDDNADIPILTSDAVDLLVNSINTDGTQYSSNGYKEGFRIRSTGEEASTSQTGSCCTGFIEISKGDELIFENIPIIASSDAISYSTSYANVALYDANFKNLSENYQWSTFNRPENNCSVNNGLIISMTVNYFGSSASLSDVKYMRLTFIKTDDNPHIYKV